MKSKQYVYVITIIFILSLIPLYIIGKYNHPSVDDYYYGVETAKVYRDTGSVSQVISTSFDEMKIPTMTGRAILPLFSLCACNLPYSVNPAMYYHLLYL